MGYKTSTYEHLQVPFLHRSVACVFRLVQTQNLPDQNVALILSEYLSAEKSNQKPTGLQPGMKSTSNTLMVKQSAILSPRQ
ncbi:MAG: hypothetical protein ACJAZ9_001431 [Neolewinella sp.]|jgi:hypothetical protein